MPPFKSTPNFKFKCFYTSCNLNDGTPLADFNVASNNRNETQSKRELAASKGKQVVTDVPMICLCSNFLTNNPSLGINLVERLQVLVEVLDQEVNNTRDYESKRNFKFLGQPNCLGLSCRWVLMVVCSL
jgi:hypothetical protein